MKKILYFSVTLTFLLSLSLAFSQKALAAWVNGYYKSNGTYVNGYYRSRPNAYTYDNYSYTGPSSSNGYGYNNRSYSSYGKRSSWYTPSYNDSGWSYENSWSDRNSGRTSYFGW